MHLNLLLPTIAIAHCTPCCSDDLMLVCYCVPRAAPCRKHDLWVLSNHPLLQASAADSSSSSSGPYDRLKQPWTVLARCAW
jgi:hypothetical protein